MHLTPNYNLKKPEGTDPVDIQDFNDNADILDAELNKKADSAGGDISNMTIKALEEPAGTQFPVPEAGETSKSFLGKIRKFMNDFKSWNTGVCMIGQIVNNCVTNNDKLPLSAAQGKVLMDLYSVLNTNFIHFDSDIRTCLNPLSSQYIAHASTSIVGKVSIFTWTADTVDTPYKTGDTAYENGFCLTYDSGSGWFTQVAMAVGDSHLFTRHCRGGGWSGWTTIGAPVI